MLTLSNFLTQGGDIKDLQYILGYSKLQDTRRLYGEIVTRKLAEDFKNPNDVESKTAPLIIRARHLLRPSFRAALKKNFWNFGKASAVWRPFFKYFPLEFLYFQLSLSPDSQRTYKIFYRKLLYNRMLDNKLYHSTYLLAKFLCNQTHQKFWLRN